MKRFIPNLKNAQGGKIYGAVDNDGNVVIDADIKNPGLQKFVAKHEGKHIQQANEQHERHKHTEAEAHLAVIKHAQTKEGKKALTAQPQTSEERDLQKEVTTLLGLYKNHGGKRRRNSSNVEAARLAAENLQGSGNPERNQ